MAKDDTPQKSSTGAFSEVLQIRDIIFGEQMQQYESVFAEHMARMDALQAQIEALDAKAQERHNQGQGDTQQQLNELKAALTARIDALAHEKTERAALGAMLVELGERIQRD